MTHVHGKYTQMSFSVLSAEMTLKKISKFGGLSVK